VKHTLQGTGYYTFPRYYSPARCFSFRRAKLMLMTDLAELKILLDINPDDRSEDVKLSFIMKYASEWIEELIGRPGLTYKMRTEIYNGTGTNKILLRSRPVFKSPTIRVFEDRGAYQGTASGSFASETELTQGEHFFLKTDQDDDTLSRSGILCKIGSAWHKPYFRQRGFLSPYVDDDSGSIKVIYYGGYTVDTLPGNFRMACNLLTARLRYLLPIGAELNSDSYEEKNVGLVTSEKEKLLTLIKPLIMTYRNWNFG
jgi:hypothetical protein